MSLYVRLQVVDLADGLEEVDPDLDPDDVLAERLVPVDRFPGGIVQADDILEQLSGRAQLLLHAHGVPPWKLASENVGKAK